MSQRRVVVTGIGCVTPIGVDKNSTWESLIAGKSGIAKITHFDPSDFSSQIAGEVSDFDPEDHFDKKELKRYDRYSVLSIVAAREAVADSGIKESDTAPERMGCILGVGIGGLRILEDNHIAMLNGGPRKVSPFLIPAMIANLGPGNIAIEHGLKGVNYTVTSACTSGTHAIGEAYRMIKDGLQDVVVGGGAEAAVTPISVAGFARMRALSTRNDEPQKASRPFDKDRDGFVIGEGSAVLVLEEYERAKSRGAEIYAEVMGYGFSCDAHHITAPEESGAGAINCMSQAIADAGISPAEMNYINAHGTSTPINDPSETRAIKTVFSDITENGLMVSSTKSMTGHLLGAAGGVEAAFSALAIKNSVVPPTINLDSPDEGCDLDYVPHTAREAEVKYAMSNSFGFGGTNASVVLGKI